MKFPLPAHPFRAVDLTPEQCSKYERVTDAMLRQTISEYDRFVHLENRTLNKKQWKAVKTRENLTVYKQTDRSASQRAAMSILGSSASAEPTIASNMHEWKLPKLLAVGSIVGTLDDVMYGVTAPDVKSMLLRSSYVNDELVDGGVLLQLKGATEEDPFQFLGIKWLVKAHPTALNALVSPRDTVVIDATGVSVQDNGDRIGYHVIHSLLLPECPELKEYSILRGHISSCYLFKQLRDGTVDVYMKTFVDPGGRLSESLSIMSVANALIGCWKSVWCAQGKKLTWLIKNNSQQRMRNRKKRPADDAKAYACELCHGDFRSYKSTRACQSCVRLVCSRCEMTRKISHMQRGLTVKQTTVVVCKECVTQASQLSACDIARDEFVGKQRLQQPSLMTDADACGDEWLLSGVSVLSDAEQTPISVRSMLSDPKYNSPSTPRTISLDSGVRKKSIELLPSDQIPSYAAASPAAWSQRSARRVSDTEHRIQLWEQMNQLRMTAEKTYLITKQNESAMRFTQATS